MIEKKETVCAIVVTYNRKELLKGCLNALLYQSFPLDAIILINNASADGTEDFLLKNGYIRDLSPAELAEPWERDVNQEGWPTIHYIRMQENTGSAGGYHEGVKKGYEKGYDWLWLMDDDVEPVPAALETMFRYSRVSSCIHPGRMYPDGTPQAWLPLDRLPRMASENLCFYLVDVGCYEGMLISRNIVEKIGYPDKRFFFIGDDTVYGFLASRHTANILIEENVFIKKIKNISLKHFLFLKSNRILNELGCFYYGRNIFLIRKYYRQYGKPQATISFIKIVLFFLIGVAIYDRSMKMFIRAVHGVFCGIMGRY
jgi:rhamnopyranosyl-N-acetylglucosaminyl-diphospho-decaprenol beta-1,3/1,4-galactofuranosyltransferase